MQNCDKGHIGLVTLPRIKSAHNTKVAEAGIENVRFFFFAADTVMKKYHN